MAACAVAVQYRLNVLDEVHGAGAPRRGGVISTGDRFTASGWEVVVAEESRGSWQPTQPCILPGIIPSSRLLGGDMHNSKRVGRQIDDSLGERHLLPFRYHALRVLDVVKGLG